MKYIDSLTLDKGIEIIKTQNVEDKLVDDGNVYPFLEWSDNDYKNDIAVVFLTGGYGCPAWALIKNENYWIARTDGGHLQLQSPDGLFTPKTDIKNSEIQWGNENEEEGCSWSAFLEQVDDMLATTLQYHHLPAEHVRNIMTDLCEILITQNNLE